MAITRGGTLSSASRTATGTDASVGHTVDANTTLLVVTTMFEAGETVTATPSWSLGGGEDLTLVDTTTLSGSNNDMGLATYALASPTAGAGTVTVTHSENDNFITTATNYIGTNASATMTENIALLEEDVNDTVTDTTAFASAGSAGNCLYAAGSFKGDDGVDGDITVPTGFFEIFEGASGTNANADISGYVCDELDGAPSACTWTWAVTDENTGHYLEIQVAGAGGEVIIVPVGSLSINEKTPSAEITHIRNVPTAVPALVLTGQVPFRVVNHIRGPPVKAVVLTGQAITLGHTITVPSGSLTFAGQTSTAKDTTVRVTFPTPDFSPKVGADLQKFRAHLRRDATNDGPGIPTVSIWLAEGGSKVGGALVTDQAITSDSGETVEATWDSANLATFDGSDVECIIEATQVGYFGARAVEFGAIEWCVIESSQPQATSLSFTG